MIQCVVARDRNSECDIDSQNWPPRCRLSSRRLLSAPPTARQRQRARRPDRTKARSRYTYLQHLPHLSTCLAALSPSRSPFRLQADPVAAEIQLRRLDPIRSDAIAPQLSLPRRCQTLRRRLFAAAAYLYLSGAIGSNRANSSRICRRRCESPPAEHKAAQLIIVPAPTCTLGRARRRLAGGRCDTARRRPPSARRPRLRRLR